MSQGKTVFKFNVNADSSLVEATIRNWLTANKFSFDPKSGLNYYAFNDPMLKGKRGFEYYINGSEVTILAYLGTYKKPQELEGFVAAVMKQDYRNVLAPLFEEIKKLEGGGAVNTAATAAYSTTQAEGNMAASQTNTGAQATGAVNNNSLNTFMEQNQKKQETLVIVGFVMSLIGLLISFCGVTYGVLLILLEYYFAIQGIKTKKKGLAIATIVIASVSIVLFIANILAYVLLA